MSCPRRPDNAAFGSSPAKGVVAVLPYLTVWCLYLAQTVKIVPAVAPLLWAKAAFLVGALCHPAAGVVFVAAVARLVHAFITVLVLRQNAVYPAFRYLLVYRIAIAFFLRRAVGVQPQYTGYLVAGILLVARFPLRTRLLEIKRYR